MNRRPMVETPPFKIDALLARWLLGAALLAIVAWGIGSAPILSHNEVRRMVVAQEIVRNGHWLLPTMNGELYITKPPLYTWLQAALATLFHSTSPGVLRLPSVLSALGLLWLLHGFVGRHAGSRQAWLAVLVLGTSQLFVMHARNAEIEMLLALFNTTALFLAWEFLRSGRRLLLYLAWISLGLAVMTKGPVALLFFVPPVLIYGLLVERPALKCLVTPLGWGLFLLVALPWYLYVYLSVDQETIHAILQRDIVAKVRKAGAPFYTYLEVIAGGFLPWLLVFFVQPPKRLWRRLRQSGAEAWLAWAVLVPVVIMSAFGAKHGKYILPLFPAMAGWLGIELGRWLEKAGERGRRLLAGTALLMLFGTALFHLVLAPIVWKHRYEAIEPIVEQVQQAGLPLVSFRQTPIQLVYYYGQPIEVVDLEKLWELRQRGQPFLLLADSRFWKRLEPLHLEVVREWPVYLKKKRKVRLYRVAPEGNSVPVA